MEEISKDYAPVGTKDCQGICDREVVITDGGPVVICHSCMRVVMDKRENVRPQRRTRR